MRGRLISGGVARVFGRTVGGVPVIGSVKRKTAPPPDLFSAQIRPP